MKLIILSYRNILFRLIAGLVCLTLSYWSYGQGGGVKIGNNPTNINKAAILELESTNKGLLLPRVQDTMVLNALNPPDGLMVYVINAPNDQHLYVRHESVWAEVQTPASVQSLIDVSLQNKITTSVDKSITSPDATLTILGGDSVVFKNVALLVNKSKVVTDTLVSQVLSSSLVLDSLSALLRKSPLSDSLKVIITTTLSSGTAIDTIVSKLFSSSSFADSVIAILNRSSSFSDSLKVLISNQLSGSYADTLLSHVITSTIVLDSLASVINTSPLSDSLQNFISNVLLSKHVLTKAGNGLSVVNADSVVLGGGLTQNTVIDIGDKNFSFYSSKATNTGNMGFFKNNPDHQLHIGVSPDQIKIDSLSVNNAADTTRDYVMIAQTVNPNSPSDSKIVKSIPVKQLLGTIQENQNNYVLNLNGLGGGSASYVLPFPNASVGNVVTVNQIGGGTLTAPDLDVNEDSGFAVINGFVSQPGYVTVTVKSPQRLSGSVSINVRIRN
jgi:hypothetical protein